MSEALDIPSIVSTLKMILPAQEQIPLHEPEFNAHANKYVNDCINSGWVSSVGSYVTRFEQQLAEFTGTKHAIATSNGTSALHICLLLSQVNPGDEVLLPDLTFIATANAVRYCHAIPHFVDVDVLNLGVDSIKLKHYLHTIGRYENGCLINKHTGNKISALIVMHSFGHPADMHSLLDCCDEFGLKLIEDAAESLGSYYQQQHTGNFARLSALSFNGNKIITTGGGGAILTNNDDLADKARHLTTTAKIPNTIASEHDQLGYNYRLPNLNAALGVAQLEQLAQKLQQKRQLAQYYYEHFATVTGVSIFKESVHCKSNYWLNLLLLEQPSVNNRDNILRQTNEAGIMTRPAWGLMHRQKMHKNCPRMADLENAKALFSSIICLPSSPQLMAEHQ